MKTGGEDYQDLQDITADERTSFRESRDLS